jgi:hypothetical protein
MNVGYGDIENLDTSCPICGSNVYIVKSQDRFKCVNPDCIMSNTYVSGIRFSMINTDTNEKVGEVDFMNIDGELYTEVRKS